MRHVLHGSQLRRSIIAIFEDSGLVRAVAGLAHIVSAAILVTGSDEPICLSQRCSLIVST